MSGEKATKQNCRREKKSEQRKTEGILKTNNLLK